MDRVTFYEGEVPFYEDIMRQEKIVLKTLSALFGGMIGDYSTGGIWLPGPYPAIPGLASANGVGYIVEPTASKVLTVMTPLSLVQPGIPVDELAWSTMSADPVGYNILGMLANSRSFDYGSLSITGQSVWTTLAGRVIVEDEAATATLFYNPADPENPLPDNKSLTRRVYLGLQDFVGNPATTNPVLPPTPSSPWTPLIDILSSGGVITVVRPNANAKVGTHLIGQRQIVTSGGYGTNFPNISIPRFSSPGKPWDSYDNGPGYGLTTKVGSNGLLVVVTGDLFPNFNTLVSPITGTPIGAMYALQPVLVTIDSRSVSSLGLCTVHPTAAVGSVDNATVSLQGRPVSFCCVASIPGPLAQDTYSATFSIDDRQTPDGHDVEWLLYSNIYIENLTITGIQV